MEHSWGRNIVEQGLGSLGGTIASRILAGFWTDWWLLNVRNDLAGLAVLVPADMHSAYDLRAVLLPDPDVNFPYGFDVDLDVHV